MKYLTILWEHRLRTVTTIAATAMLVRYNFSEFPQIEFWAGKIGDIANGLAAIITGHYVVTKK
jgi:hypothetical protein